MTAKLHVNPHAKPRFFRPRSVPYALRSRVERALESLESEGIIERVDFSEWAAPIVPVVKRDGTIRICGDYKLTVNQAACVDAYPLPRVDDLFASLAGGTSFTKLDLAHAYNQLLLDEESRSYVTIITLKGLYRYTRLPFGVAAAPAIFQRTMEAILRDLPHVCVYLDDILVTGESEAAHLRNLAAVLQRLESAGIHLKQAKCAFMMPEVEYLGHCISGKGLQPLASKIQAITDAPMPTNVSQLKSFLGMLTYYGRFLPDLATTLAPLYELLQSNRKWSWEGPQRMAFQRAKESLSTSPLLTHYDPQKPLLLACDASPYGLGAVLSHLMADGKEQLIAFVSRTLSPAERKYAQLDKEALAIVFGVKRYHQYLYGRKFTIQSDHKPLQFILGENHSIPPMASARIQRWALTLSAYDYAIGYKPGAQHSNADALSRLPLPEQPSAVPLPGEMVLVFETLNQSPLTATQIKWWVDKDPLLSRVRENVRRGWRDSVEAAMQPYQSRQAELSVHDGCLLWGSRVVIPPQGRAAVITLIHEGHPGITRMKRLARGYVWWPGMDRELEDAVKHCVKCQEHQKAPAKAPMHPWEWPERPWARVHIDYAGPIQGKMVLVIVDAHSKWLEAHIVQTANSRATIEKLRSVFATHGLPELLVSDNGSPFTSAEFTAFTQKNGIKHLTSAPYHPASNGLAERAVQTLKTAIKKGPTGVPLETLITRFLFQYRLRQERSFVVGDPVSVRNQGSGPPWLAGLITTVVSPQRMVVLLEDGRSMERHVDHLHRRATKQDETNQSTEPFLPITETQDGDAADTPPPPPSSTEDTCLQQLRRSSRTRQPPDRLV